MALFDENHKALIRAKAQEKGCSELEVEQFVHFCEARGLDPMQNQVWLCARWDRKAQRNNHVPETTIDGLRLIADRTGRYAPGSRTVYEEEGGRLVGATAFVKKRTDDGTWHVVEASVQLEELAARDNAGNITGNWASMPRVMLGKCAEAAALRRAFPGELGGLYSREEMEQAGEESDTRQQTTVPPQTLPPERAPAGSHTPAGRPVESATPSATSNALAPSQADGVDFITSVVEGARGNRPDGSAWTRYDIITQRGVKASSFDTKCGEIARQYMRDRIPCAVVTRTDRGYQVVDAIQNREGGAPITPQTQAKPGATVQKLLKHRAMIAQVQVPFKNSAGHDVWVVFTNESPPKEFGCFSAEFADLLAKARESGAEVDLTYTTTAKGNSKLIDAKLVPVEVAAPQVDPFAGQPMEGYDE